MRGVGLLIAVVLALVAGFVTMKLLGSDRPSSGGVVANVSQPDYQTVNVLIARKEIPIGEKIDASMLDTQPWPSHLLGEGFVTDAEQSKKVVGMMTRSSFQAREPILTTKISSPNDPSFLAAALPKGKKVVTISTDGVAGVAGFVYPGDRVDVIVTHKIPKPTDDSHRILQQELETVTETLLSNVKVLAVDQRASGGAVPKDKKALPSSISLEVTLEEAQRLRLAQDTGYVSMTLRSLLDKDVQDKSVVTFVRDLNTSGAYKKEGEAQSNKVVIIRGTRAEQSDSVIGNALAQETMNAENPNVGGTNAQ
jgi:pilus assembly protein CpaB